MFTYLSHAYNKEKSLFYFLKRGKNTCKEYTHENRLKKMSQGIHCNGILS